MFLKSIQFKYPECIFCNDEKEAEFSVKNKQIMLK